MKDGEGLPLQPPPEAAALTKYMSTQLSSADANGTCYVGNLSNCLLGIRSQIEIEESQGFVERLRAAEREIRRIVAELQRSPTPERAAEARTAVHEMRALATPPEEPPETVRREIAPGDRVRVRGVGITGEVVSVRSDGVEVRAGAMTMRLRAEDVEILATAPPVTPSLPSSAASRRIPHHVGGGSAAEASLETAIRVPRNTLDLRGVRVEEGLAKLEAFLDDSMLANLDAVFVLHGHGTGALKSAIRAALDRSPYVTASGPAADDQGGDAFTVARLRD
jgi:DNA mismatch repair protein MutS2